MALASYTLAQADIAHRRRDIGMIALAVLASVLQAATSPAVAWFIAIACVLIWLLKNPSNKAAAALVRALLVLFPCAALLFNWYLTWADRVSPVKYDYVLFAIDRAFGLPSFALAGAWFHTAAGRLALGAAYGGLDAMLVVCYMWAVVNGRNARELFKAFLFTFGIGCLLYLILPACGPVYACAGFPRSIPASAPRAIHGLPNCVPSLHIAAALVCLLFAAGKMQRRTAQVFLIATVFTTLATGEHYAIDLILGVPFAFFAAAAARSHWRHAVAFLILTVAPMLAIRFGASMIAG